MYEYKLKSVDHIVDGDTFDATVDLGFNVYHKVRIRLQGINTPESRTRDLVEKAAGLKAKARITELLENDNLVLQTRKKGKYGRWLGLVFYDDAEGYTRDIANTLIVEGYGVEYHGGKR